MRWSFVVYAAGAMLGVGCEDRGDADRVGAESQDLTGARAIANGVPMRNPNGFAATISTMGSIDLRSEFFQNLGTNGRTCASCHQADQGWTVSPPRLRERFETTGGTDPIFRTNDGSNSPSADVSTVAKRRRAYSQLLTKGLIRIGLPVSAAAEFELVAVDDPYGFASAAELSLFRRPLPATNLKFLSTVMWDGRETFSGQSIHFDLLSQANDATTGHAQGAPLTTAQREAIVGFATSLSTAQVFDDRAGILDLHGAHGGPRAIAAQPFYIGINDDFGDSVTHAPFDPVVFTLFEAWAHPDRGRIDLDDGNRERAAARASIARGETIFNTRPIAIRGVSGINDEAAFGFPEVVNGTCTTCHDAPDAGSHSVVAPLNLGLTDASRRTPDMPLYTLRNKVTGELKRTTDPGRALISGRWKDIGRFKGPVLRALSARAPYFHNGSAATLADVIDFYENRFELNLSRDERADLEAFLRAL